MFIIPNYPIDSDFSKNNIRFSTEYMSPKMESTSEFSRFLGASNQKLNKEYLTHTKDITFDETLKIIDSFSKQKNVFFRKKG